MKKKNVKVFLYRRDDDEDHSEDHVLSEEQAEISLRWNSQRKI
jgi:hypothetical protein